MRFDLWDRTSVPALNWILVHVKRSGERVVEVNRMTVSLAHPPEAGNALDRSTVQLAAHLATTERLRNETERLQNETERLLKQ